MTFISGVTCFTPTWHGSDHRTTKTDNTRNTTHDSYNFFSIIDSWHWMIRSIEPGRRQLGVAERGRVLDGWKREFPSERLHADSGCHTPSFKDLATTSHVDNRPGQEEQEQQQEDKTDYWSLARTTCHSQFLDCENCHNCVMQPESASAAKQSANAYMRGEWYRGDQLWGFRFSGLQDLVWNGADATGGRSNAGLEYFSVSRFSLS